MTMKRIRLVLGDITRQNTDAIVNSAHESLAPGGGVSGAIHSAAGSELAEECREFKGLRAGEAVITKGYNLPAKYVIHTVAPRWLQQRSSITYYFKPDFLRIFIDFARRILAVAEWLFMRALRRPTFWAALNRTVPETRFLMRIFLPLRIAIFILYAASKAGS